MRPGDKITHVVYIIDNTEEYNLLSITEKHRFCKMIHVKSYIPFKYISWIIFLLRCNLSPFCYLFCGDKVGVWLSTAFQSGKWKDSTIGWELRSVVWESVHQNPWALLACVWSSELLIQNLQELRESSGNMQAGGKKNHIFNSLCWQLP